MLLFFFATKLYSLCASFPGWRGTIIVFDVSVLVVLWFSLTGKHYIFLFLVAMINLT